MEAQSPSAVPQRSVAGNAGRDSFVEVYVLHTRRRSQWKLGVIVGMPPANDRGRKCFQLDGVYSPTIEEECYCGNVVISHCYLIFSQDISKFVVMFGCIGWKNPYIVFS